MTYPYILPPLPYAPAALEPNLGRSSVRLHHDAFFAAYVDRLNGALVPWTQYQDWPLERLLLHWCQLPRTLGQAVRRYGGGVYNHGLYFSSLAPARTTKPSGELLAEVEHSFGSVEGLHRSLKNAAMSVFGSGWVWLVCCSGGCRSPAPPTRIRRCLCGLCSTWTCGSMRLSRTMKTGGRTMWRRRWPSSTGTRPPAGSGSGRQGRGSEAQNGRGFGPAV